MLLGARQIQGSTMGVDQQDRRSSGCIGKNVSCGQEEAHRCDAEPKNLCGMFVELPLEHASLQEVPAWDLRVLHTVV